MTIGILKSRGKQRSILYLKRKLRISLFKAITISKVIASSRSRTFAVHFTSDKQATQVYEPRVVVSLGHSTIKGNPTPMKGNNIPRRKLGESLRATRPTWQRRVFKHSSSELVGCVVRACPRDLAKFSFGVKRSRRRAMTLRIADGNNSLFDINDSMRRADNDRVHVLHTRKINSPD